MKENIVIPIKIERVKLWTRWMLEATTWLICLGLLAASAGVAAIAAIAALVWLVSGSEMWLQLVRMTPIHGRIPTLLLL